MKKEDNNNIDFDNFEFNNNYLLCNIKMTDTNNTIISNNVFNSNNCI